MKTSQALLICGCFEEGIDTAFVHGGKYYHLFVKEEVEGRSFDLGIHELDRLLKSVSFPVADVAVNDGYLVFDLGAELDIRIPLEDYEEGSYDF